MSACSQRELSLVARGFGPAFAGLKACAAAGMLSAVLLCGLAQPVAAQETHVLVVTGVAGDDEHAQRFHKWASTIVDAAKKRGGVPEANVTYLAEKPDQDPTRIRGRSTKESVEKAFADIAARARPNDEVFVLLIGHGSFDGRQSAFNLPGPDLTATDYAALLAKLQTQRVAFVNTASASGGFLAALAGPGRTIVTATKTGGERNETRFPSYFVEAFEDNAADSDRNGRVSVFEAFEYARTKVAKSYEQQGLILTEHAALDDGNQGKLAATLFLESDRSRAAAAATIADPALRALIEQQRALEDQIGQLKLRQTGMDATQYEQQMEKLLVDLAVKTRAIRELEGKK